MHYIVFIGLFLTVYMWKIRTYSCGTQNTWQPKWKSPMFACHHCYMLTFPSSATVAT